MAADPRPDAAARDRFRAWLNEPISIRLWLLVLAACIAFVIILPQVLLRVNP